MRIRGAERRRSARLHTSRTQFLKEIAHRQHLADVVRVVNFAVQNDDSHAARDRLRCPLVMSMELHSVILGQPYRLRPCRRVIEHITAHRDAVWLTCPGENCAHIESLPAGIVPGF